MCPTVVGLLQRQASINSGMYLSYISGASTTVVFHEMCGVHVVSGGVSKKVGVHEF